MIGDQPLPDEAVCPSGFTDSLTQEDYEKASSRLDAALTPIDEKFYPLDDEIYEALCVFADARGLNPIEPP